jgi:hypothetical protein
MVLRLGLMSTHLDLDALKLMSLSAANPSHIVNRVRKAEEMGATNTMSLRDSVLNLIVSRLVKDIIELSSLLDCVLN